MIREAPTGGEGLYEGASSLHASRRSKHSESSSDFGSLMSASSDSETDEDPLNGVILFLEESKEATTLGADGPNAADGGGTFGKEEAREEQVADQVKPNDGRNHVNEDAAEVNSRSTRLAPPASGTKKKTNQRQQRYRDADCKQQVLRRFKAEQRLLKIKQSLDDQVTALIR